MNGGWGRLIKYSHHTDAFYRRSFHLLLVYLLASIIALRLFVLDLQRFILGKINSSPSRSDFTWKLEMITAIFLSTNESNEMKRNRSYFIVDSSITPASMTELNYSHRLPRRKRKIKIENKLKYDSERENKQTAGWQSALKGNFVSKAWQIQ